MMRQDQGWRVRKEQAERGREGGWSESRGGQGQARHEDQERRVKEGEKGGREQCGKGMVSPGWE